MNCDRSLWQNLSGDFMLTPERHCHPSTLSDLVDIVQEAERAHPPRTVRAAGSSWSLSDAPATPDYLVEMKALNRTLDHVIPRALREEVRLERTAHQPTGQRYGYYHVEAGITIDDLCRRLDRRDSGRWALATMGGAIGQTLAGAIATGTHGSDVHLPPMADLIEAVHLVGPGGRQHWIERGQLTEDEVLCDLYPGLVVHHNDELFNAVLVSVGRMGLIYALVIRVVPQYGLEERRFQSIWKNEVPGLLDGTIFSDVRFAQIMLDPYATATGDHICYVTTRREIDPPSKTHSGSVPSLSGLLCRYRTIGQLLVRVVGFLLLVVLPISVVLGARRLIDRVLMKLAALVLIVLPISDASLGDLIAGVCNAANAARQDWLTIALARRILAAAQPEEGTSDSCPRRGLSYEIAPVASRPDECYRGATVELFFDATGTAHIDFINDDLLPTFDAFRRMDGPVLGYVSVRFTRRSGAYLAMQRWDRTCSIEVALLKGVKGNEPLLHQLERAAVVRGGTVHWGQGNTLTAGDVSRMYPQYRLWREQLRSLSVDGGQRTFENAYCAKRGLIP